MLGNVAISYQTIKNQFFKKNGIVPLNKNKNKKNNKNSINILFF